MICRVTVAMLVLAALGGLGCAASKKPALPPPEYEPARLPPWRPALPPEAPIVPELGAPASAEEVPQAAPESGKDPEGVEVQDQPDEEGSGGSSALDGVPST